MPVPVPIRVPVVSCKRCSETIPAQAHTLPKEAVPVSCPLCRERRQYRPSEVYLGSPSYRFRAHAQALTLVR